MRIFMTSDTYLPKVGGAEIHVKELRKRLIALGHDVRLLTNETERDISDDVVTFRVPWRLRGVVSLFLRVWRLSKGCDVFHSHYSYRLAMVTGLVARSRRRPFFVTLHGMGVLDHPGTPWVYAKAHALYRWMSLHLATKVISTSRDLEEACRKHVRTDRVHDRYWNLVEVIPNGVDTSAFDPARVEPDARVKGDPAILTVRRLVPKNGIHYAIAAMPLILKRHPKAVLNIVGDGRMAHLLKHAANRHGVREECVFHGDVPNADVPGFLKAADVVLFPSTAESTSIACIEAMAMGKRIVASDVGGLPELLEGGNGTLVRLVPWTSCSYGAPDALPEDRYVALADAVDEALRLDTGSAARKASAAYDWDAIAARTEKLYRRAI
ncbi:glycosyltransferase family 4 protein [Candidatus Uhrbacteria bacterium]|nr:glycosyltransferase family 4 protein [Candidatus Uhrbacteria bacterium]